jgi:DNA-directed RNA polymerase subunit alpha
LIIYFGRANERGDGSVYGKVAHFGRQKASKGDETVLDLELPRIMKKTTRGHLGCYEIGPVLAGFSRSLASALRRVLLSSLEGAAITSILIEGVQHEFQDIPNVKEDVPDIVQNIKKIRIRCYSNHPVTVHLDVQGEHEVTARDIITPSSVEIVTLSAPIATLDNANAHLVMDMTAASGRGFISADMQAEQSKEEQPIGVILLDALYSPIVKAHFTLEELCRGRSANLDTIVLEVTTDGTISPDEALRQSANILRQQFAVVANNRYETNAPKKPRHLSDILIPSSIYNLPVEDLGMSLRPTNALRRTGITKVGQLLVMDEQEATAIRNFGEKSLQELVSSLKSLDLLPTDEK